MEYDGEKKESDIGLCCYCYERPASVIGIMDFIPPVPNDHGWTCHCNPGSDFGAFSVFCESCAMELEVDDVMCKAFMDNPVIVVGTAKENHRIAVVASDMKSYPHREGCEDEG